MLSRASLTALYPSRTKRSIGAKSRTENCSMVVSRDRKTKVAHYPNSLLIVDPDTMLTLPGTAQRRKPVSWNCRHVLQLLGVVQHPKLPARHRSNVAEPAAP